MLNSGNGHVDDSRDRHSSGLLAAPKADVLYRAEHRFCVDGEKSTEPTPPQARQRRCTRRVCQKLSPDV